MRNSAISLLSLLSILSLFSLFCTTLSHEEQRSTYIIHVSKSHKPTIFTTHHHWYSSILHNLPQSTTNPCKLLYTYDHAAHGFSAHLTALQAAALRRLPGILSVDLDRLHHLHTTHTPTFLGLANLSGIWPDSDYADDVIIGVLDTGVWPESPSFSDAGLSAVPGGWNGVCEVGPDFPASSCNKKLIGARVFYKGYEESLGEKMNETIESRSPRDTAGHGTHTASTAAGAAVEGAGFYNFSFGIARGMATKARIAAYKICWLDGCYDSDIIAAMDMAIADGVDVVSISVSLNYPAVQYYKDSIAIASFGAIQNGVIVVASAGNDGPADGTTMNIAPWILTVGASTVDREFPAEVVLGDGTAYTGVSLYTGEPLVSSFLPLVDGQTCSSLSLAKVSGKIVVCENDDGGVIEKGEEVRRSGGVGMIISEAYGQAPTADLHLIPAANVGKAVGDSIRRYIESAKSPTATIVFKGTVIGPSPPAPKVAPFSSRGPLKKFPYIIKPDLIAPGVNILAGWTGFTSPTGFGFDPRRVVFNIDSGTSMSCPHVSGLSALLLKAHPSWSPAAIKSALMTTAYNADNSGSNFEDLGEGVESTPFIHGAGHVDSNEAVKPGLIYDISTDDYVTFLCAIGYEADQIAIFLKDRPTINCSTLSSVSPGDLNYPSFSVVFKSDRESVQHRRTVINVGGAEGSVYVAQFSGPPSVTISVSPSELVFSGENQSLSYVVTFTSVGNPTANPSFGSITWSDGPHIVRSPVAFTWSPS